MTKFTFTAVEEDGTITSVYFDSPTWVDTFPKYLNLMRGAGFNIEPDTMLIAPGVSESIFGDREFLHFEEIKETLPHSKYYYDFDRNK